MGTARLVWGGGGRGRGGTLMLMKQKAEPYEQNTGFVHAVSCDVAVETV